MTNGVNNEVYEEIIEDAPVVEVPYGDLYLKFTDEAQSIEVLAGYEGSIDVIGIMYTTDNTDPENPVVTPEDGWHVNTRGPMPDDFMPFEVFPVQPRRIWA
jgi:hypothetical protein